VSVAFGLDDLDWAAAAVALRGGGWWLARAVIPHSALAELADAAPSDWRRLPEEEAGVRQAGWSVHADVSEAAPVVQALASSIRARLDGAASAESELPTFNHAQWGRGQAGEGFITPHRDPPGAAGVIAIVTLHGTTTFRAWDEDTAAEHEWQTETGDLVILRGHGWPTSDSRCPRHQVEPIVDGTRAILTLRHNRLGFGGNYFT